MVLEYVHVYVQVSRHVYTCTYACASGDHASRLSWTGSATAADPADPGRVTGWRGNRSDTLAASLNRMPGVQAVLEPTVLLLGEPRRGDINVIKSGTSWILDLGIIAQAHNAS
jgi:hypothetical protein